MKRPADRLTKAAIVCLVVVSVIVVATDRPAKHSSATLSSIGTTTQRTTTVQPPAKPPAAASKPTANKLPAIEKRQLTSRAQKFLERYYLLKPDDTVASRRRRVRPFVAAGSLPLLDLGLSPGTLANQARVRQGLVQRAVVSTTGLQVPMVSSAKNMQTVIGQVTLTTTRPNGQTLRRIVLWVASSWQLQHGQWYLVNFDKGEGDTG